MKFPSAASCRRSTCKSGVQPRTAALLEFNLNPVKARPLTRELLLVLCGLAVGFGLGNFRASRAPGDPEGAGAGRATDVEAPGWSSSSGKALETKYSVRRTRPESKVRESDGTTLTFSPEFVERVEIGLIDISGYGGHLNKVDEGALRAFGLGGRQIELFNELVADVVETCRIAESGRFVNLKDSSGNEFLVIRPESIRGQLQPEIEDRLRAIGGSKGAELAAIGMKNFEALTSGFGEKAVVLVPNDDRADFAMVSRQGYEIGMDACNGNIREFLKEYPFAEKGSASGADLKSRFGEFLQR